MSLRVRLLIASAGGVAVLLLGLFFYGKWAIHQIQPFYSDAIQIAPSTLENAGLELESRVTALVSDAVENDSWQAAFSDDEVNGWLATVLPDKFADLLPKTISDPRVAFSDGTAAFGFRYQDAGLPSVITIRFSAMVDKADVVAIRLLQAHAGKLPIPISRIVEYITAGAIRQQIAVRWTQQDGDPVALIPLAGLFSTTHAERHLNVIEFHEDELYLAGNTQSTPSPLAEKE